MSTPRGHILLLGKIHEDAMQLLRSHDELTHEVLEKPSQKEISIKLAKADALIIRTTKLSADMMDKANQLKIVARHGVGYDNIPVDVLSRKKIPLATTGNANAITVAEHALYLILTLAKRGSTFDRAMREGDWESRNRLQGSEIFGKNLLLVGYGRIGREVAKRALAFGMRIHVFDPYVDSEQVIQAGAIYINDLGASLSETDFLSLHLPFTLQNRHIIGASEIKTLPTTAYVINTARGGLIDEDELLKALDAGTLAGAGLDCFEQEPPQRKMELLRSDKVVLSPHNASLTAECTRRLGLVCVENVVDALTGRLQKDRVVNWEAVYS
ncbi:MAG: 3-phosphoglycerate dehydrogenase [SAR324 cluster bacterium]|uniref:3-phosphoglycerate dehydrogenase n=1 Tax=SAR324 cluster bacterium TaxID=2024889 RepID=A0A2D6YNC6_9DELT|nr:3-phosphoglycerate dehydrogenase [SAR324 cluster bacterium]